MNKREVKQREAVVAEAQRWLRTPFHDCAALHGIGVDCANLLAQVYEGAGVVQHVDIKPYSPQWFLHRSEELFLGYVLGAGGREIPEEEVLPGDCALFKIGRCYAHGAIIVGWPDAIIHAHKPAGAVIETRAIDLGLGSIPRRFFTMWG